MNTLLKLQTILPLVIMIFLISSPLIADSKLPSPADSPGKVQPLKVGDFIPDGTLLDIEGKTFDLAKAVSEKPSILVFYRGGW